MNAAIKRTIMHSGMIVLALLLTAYISLFAQESGAPETTVPLVMDSVVADTLLADSAVPKSDGVDTVVTYAADEIFFDVIRKVSVLSGHAEIKYKEMTLEAGQVTVDWNAQLLTATALADTVYTDSTETEIDTIVFVGKPHFIQGRDDFYGDEIAYNMKTRVGKVRGASTVYEQGYYKGEQFKRISENVVTVRHGEFTSCDAAEPHYHFASQRLKIQIGKRVVAEPVVLYFDDVPVLAAPYGIFPQQKGRTSGIIVPTFGESASQGRFLRDVGYYIVPSDYMDLRTSIDYFEKFGVLGDGEFRYAKRYALNGGVRYSFNTQKLENSPRRRDYSINATHNQTINENTRVTAAGGYASSDDFYENRGSVQDQLTQTISSSAQLSKSWYDSPWTLGVNVRYEQNLKTDSWTSNLPSLSLNHRNGLLFPPPKAPLHVRHAVAPKEANPPWYRAFQWSYSAIYRNSLVHQNAFEETGIELGEVDSLGHQGSSRRLGETHLFTLGRDGAVHTGGISANAKVLRYINLNPRIGLRHVWSPRAVNYVPADSILDRADDFGFFTRTTFDVGTSATTKLYGMAQRPFGLHASFRHVMTPSVSFTYTPDFSDKAWGYYKTAALADGRSLRFDRFGDLLSDIGATPGAKSELFGFSLDHLYQMKTGTADDETGKRVDLLAVGMRSGLDLKRDSLKWSDLSMSFRTAIPGRILGPIESPTLNISTIHSPYQTVAGRKVDRFFWDRPGGSVWSPLELISMNTDVSVSLRAETVRQFFGLDRLSRTPTDTDSSGVDSIPEPQAPTNVLQHRRFEQPSPFERQTGSSARDALLDMPLALNMNFHRSKNFQTGTSTATMAANTQFSITPLWSMQFDYNFDLDDKVVTNAGVSVTRDLHCWEANLLWSPLGYRPGYYFRVGLKSPQLRDVQVKRDRQRGFSR